MSTTYTHRRSQIEHYFDRTAAETWAQLTSDAPVSRIRATVRAGRDQMRTTLLSWLGADLTGKTVLDAGCGTGALSAEAGARGAMVLGVDVSASLVDVARARLPETLARAVRFAVGDMLDPAGDPFDAVVAMDSLIHYEKPDALTALAALAQRTKARLVFTHAPQTVLLSAMHGIGRLLPKSDRAPAIVPVAHDALVQALRADSRFADFAIGRTARVDSGFYMSQALELVRR